jgi:3',5'-cyclic AMP phosphodiesterase CpdA
MRTIVHLSDLHFGRVDPALLDPLVAAVAAARPDVVAISGDLTQRARKAQFRQARVFLDRLPQPQIVVPGNHDVPLYDVVRRFAAPLRRYRRYITDDLAPAFGDDEIAIVGLNTARSLTFKGGRINVEQAGLVTRRFAGLDDSILRVVVTHHPFNLPEHGNEDDLVGRASMAMRVFADCGVDLLLSGHLHRAHAGDTASRYEIPGFAALVVQAGTATSTRGRGEPNAFNVIRAGTGRIEVDVQSWRPDRSSFAVLRTDVFERVGGTWSRVQPD